MQGAPGPLLKDRHAAPHGDAPLVPEPADGLGSSTLPDTGLGDSGFDPDKRKPRDLDAPRYVGGIR
ncbi:hypothetical protein GCM10027034_45700 [Ramlibacter solisilvae]|uniref:Uncharacterized protein n=1 Tax=Ramlibacter tataouinensis TaxID=94132 RepID=A0A127JSR8_9BURK|nr:hypothetical protein [Ramlibacter tataouinensis]AMO23007.1 hypothetical protein UC35_09040 [Ramlibacter tataouinensis]